MATEDNPIVYGNGSKGIIIAIIIAIAILGGAYLLSKSAPNIYLNSDNAQQLNKISVSGTATEKVSPDLLVIAFRIQTELKDAKTSQSDNAALVSNFKTKMLSIGVPEKSIKTTSYQVVPVYKQKPCESGDVKCYTSSYYQSYLAGYQTIQTISIELTDLKLGGNVIDSGSSVGVNETFVDGISFTLQEQTRRELESALLKKAAMSSKLKAQNIADGLGVSLGKAIMGSETSTFNYAPRNYGYSGLAMMQEDSSIPTQLSSGEIEVSATVSTQYQIQ